MLIDEYDIPLQSAFLHAFYNDAVEFLKSLAVLKDSTVVQMGIMSGIMTLAKSGIFTGLNNLNVFNLTSIYYADKFGFTHDEVSSLLQYYDIQDPQKEIEQ